LRISNVAIGLARREMRSINYHRWKKSGFQRHIVPSVISLMRQKQQP